MDIPETSVCFLVILHVDLNLLFPIIALNNPPSSLRRDLPPPRRRLTSQSLCVLLLIPLSVFPPLDESIIDSRSDFRTESRGGGDQRDFGAGFEEIVESTGRDGASTNEENRSVEKTPGWSSRQHTYMRARESKRKR